MFTAVVDPFRLFVCIKQPKSHLLRLEHHTEVFGETYILMCLFLPSYTDLSHDCWWAVLFTLRRENASLLGKNCNLGVIDALYPTATSLRETLGGLLLNSICFSLFNT